MSSKADEPPPPKGPPPPKEPRDPKHSPLLTDSVKKKLKKLRKKRGGTLPHWAATADLTLADKTIDTDSDSDGSLSDLPDHSILTADPCLKEVGRKFKRKASFFAKDGPPAKRNFTASAMKALEADSPASTRKPAPATHTPSTAATSRKPAPATDTPSTSGTSRKPAPSTAPRPLAPLFTARKPSATTRSSFKPRSRSTLSQVKRRLYTPSTTPTPDSSRPASRASEATEPDRVLEDITSANDDDTDYRFEASQVQSDTSGNLNLNPRFFNLTKIKIDDKRCKHPFFTK